MTATNVRRPRARDLLVVAACSVLLGCGSAGNTGSAGSTGDSGSPEPTPGAGATASSATAPVSSSSGSGDPTESGPPPLDAANATPVPSDALDVLAKWPLIEDGQSVGVLALDAAGTMLLSRTPATEEEELTSGELVLRDPHGQETTFTATPRPRHTQVIDATFNDRYVVWMETASVDITSQQWVLYTYDRADRTVRVLTRSPRRQGRAQPPAPGYTGPVLAGDRVFWAQVDGTPKAPTVDIVGCQVTDCTPEVVIPGAAYPAVADGTVYAVANDRFTGSKVGREMVIEAAPAGGGEVTQVTSVELSPTQFPSGLAAGGAGLVWLIQDSAGADQASVWFAGEETVRTVESASNGGFAFPIATQRYVAWAEGTGSAKVANFVMDPTGALHTLGTTGGLYGITGAGDIAAWRDLKSGGSVDRDNIEYLIARLRLPQA